mgnify:CR=1 FL=1
MNQSQESRAENERLANAYLVEAETAPRIMHSACFGGGGGTQGKSPGCTDENTKSISNAVKMKPQT